MPKSDRNGRTADGRNDDDVETIGRTIEQWLEGRKDNNGQFGQMDQTESETQTDNVGRGRTDRRQ